MVTIPRGTQGVPSPRTGGAEPSQGCPTCSPLELLLNGAKPTPLLDPNCCCSVCGAAGGALCSARAAEKLWQLLQQHFGAVRFWHSFQHLAQARAAFLQVKAPSPQHPWSTSRPNGQLTHQPAQHWEPHQEQVCHEQHPCKINVGEPSEYPSCSVTPDPNSTNHRDIPPAPKVITGSISSSTHRRSSHLRLSRQAPSGRESCWHTSHSATRHKPLLSLYPDIPLSPLTSAGLLCTAWSGWLSLAKGCWPHTQAPELVAAGRGIPAAPGEAAKHLPGHPGQESACQETKAMSKLVQPVAASAEGQLGTEGV